MLNICKLTLAIAASFIASFLIICLLAMALGFVPPADGKSAMESATATSNFNAD